MSFTWGWFMPVLITCIVHGVVTVLPVNFHNPNIEDSESTVTFKLVSAPQTSLPPSLGQPAFLPEKKPPPRSVPPKQTTHSPPKPRTQPQDKIKLQEPVLAKVAPALTDLDTVQLGDASPGQTSIGSISAPAFSTVSRGTSSGPVALSPGELSVVCPEMNEPLYPVISRQLGEYGTVMLELELDKSGRMIEVQIIKSSGYERLDKAAISAVNTWHCNSPLHNGQPVQATAQQQFNFALQRN